MAYEAILLDVKDRVATITLNRPDRMNAWSAELSGELSEAMRACHENEEVRAVVVTGSGRAFCAGADLSRRRGDAFGGGGGERRAEPRRERPALFLPHHVAKPVIAAMNGHAVGVGITYAMLCDVRYVAEDAKIQFAFVRRGILPELASHVVVPRVIGLSNAADLLLSGRMIRGKEAAELGLASRALPAADVLPAAQEYARDLAANAAPVSVAISKRLLWEGLTASVEEMQRRENPLFAWTGGQPDAREGVQSFLEKRAPEWKLAVPRDIPESLRGPQEES